MLSLLLDEHISPGVAKGLRRRLPNLTVYALIEWDGGQLLEQDDSMLLTEALKQGLTLVTYDMRTIPPLLKRWAEEGRSHGGVVFVDDKTIRPSDTGALIRSLEVLVEASRDWDWVDRISFLVDA